MSAHDNTIIGALPPPAGVTPNFRDPYSIQGAIVGFNIFLFILNSIITWIRLWTKMFSIKHFSWPEYTMVFAYCAFLAYFGILTKGFEYPAAGRHQWNVPITTIPGFTYWGWVAEWFYLVSICPVRISICLQFLELFAVGRTRRFWIMIGFICINLIFYIAMLFVDVFQCLPPAKLWNPELDGHCMGRTIEYIFIAVGSFNVAGDLFMLAYPLYFIGGLHATKTRRLGLSGLFMVGLLGVVASILRLVFSVFNLNSLDQTYTLAQVGECTFCEVSAGMLVANLISLPAFLSTFTVKYKDWLASRGSREKGYLRQGSSRSDFNPNKGSLAVQLGGLGPSHPSQQSMAADRHATNDF